MNNMYPIASYTNGSLLLPECKINILNNIKTNQVLISPSETVEFTEECGSFYNELNFLENPFFFDFFDAGNSPEIKIDEAVMYNFIRDQHPGFYCNTVKEGKYFRIINDSERKHFFEYVLRTDSVKVRYEKIIDFLGYANLAAKENIDYRLEDLSGLRLGKKQFAQEFKHFIKILPFGSPFDSSSHTDFPLLYSNIREIILDDAKIKTMTDWDLHSFNKFHLSFCVDDEDIDKPYVKIYTRDEAEAAQLLMRLMDKNFVEVIE